MSGNGPRGNDPGRGGHVIQMGPPPSETEAWAKAASWLRQKVQERDQEITDLKKRLDEVEGSFFAGDGWINTYTGRKVYPLNLQLDDLDIIDIAHALSHVCRYAGHVTQFYSVAQHSVHVSQFVPPEYAMWGLLHDASEAYLGDVPRPWKRAPWMKQYREAERRVMEKVVEFFGLEPKTEPPEVKRVDTLICGPEADLLMAKHPDWTIPEYPQEWKFRLTRAWHPKEAKLAFLIRFEELLALHGGYDA